MKKSVFILLMMPIFIGRVYGQLDCFVEASANYSFITESDQNVYLTQFTPQFSGFQELSLEYKMVEQYDSKPGFDVLFGVRKSAFKKISVEGGIGVSLIYFKRKVTLEEKEQRPLNSEAYPQYGQSYGDIYYRDIEDDYSGQSAMLGSTENGKTNILYLVLPVNLSYSVLENRLSIGAGVSPSILVLSRQVRDEMVLEGPYEWRLKPVTDKSNDGLNKLIWNGNILLQYRVLNNAWINLAYQHSFSPVYEEEEHSTEEAKSRLVKLGLRYYL